MAASKTKKTKVRDTLCVLLHANNPQRQKTLTHRLTGSNDMSWGGGGPGEKLSLKAASALFLRGGRILKIQKSETKTRKAMLEKAFVAQMLTRTPTELT